MKTTPKPSRREEIALFRLGVIGDLLTRDLERGELKAELQRRAQLRYRPPGAPRTRRFHYKTLQRWYYTAKKDTALALEPQSRARGHALALTNEQRELLLQIRQAHRNAAAELILAEAVRHGIVAEGQLSLSTLRRLYHAAGLPRVSKRQTDRVDVQRRRWQAAHPGELWHGDVCHLVLASEAAKPRRVLVHGFMDDSSRYIVALVGRTHERERDMLEVLCGALLRHPAPRTVYLDNGSCYRSKALAVVCKRLGIHLVHATPYSPEARGKMERVWRTMRQRCTDHLPATATLHQVNQAVASWLDVDYHRRPHGALMGLTPRRRYLDGLGRLRKPVTPSELARALEVSLQRQVRRDGTFTLDGTVYEVSGRHLCGKRIALVIDALTGKPIRASWQDKPVRFGLCNPVTNRHRKRSAAQDKASHDPTSQDNAFDPIASLLEKAREVQDD